MYKYKYIYSMDDVTNLINLDVSNKAIAKGLNTSNMTAKFNFKITDDDFTVEVTVSEILKKKT